MNSIYEFIAPYYDKLQQDVDYQRLAEWICMNLKPSARILDLGCGTGELLLKLSELGHYTSGIDGSKAMIEIAKQKLDSFPHAHVYHLSIEKLNLLKGKFDAIVLTLDTLNYIIDKNAIKLLAKQLYRLLNHEGKVFIDIQNPKNLIELDHYHQMIMLEDDVVLDWYSYRPTKLKPLINHHLRLYQNDILVGEELHTQKFNSINYYRSLWFEDLKLVKTIKTDHRFYLTFVRRKDA